MTALERNLSHILQITIIALLAWAGTHLVTLIERQAAFTESQKLQDEEIKRLRNRVDVAEQHMNNCK